MSKFNVHKWRAGAAKRMKEFDILHPQVHKLMAKMGWHVICQATEKEDRNEKYRPAATPPEVVETANDPG